MTYSCNKASKMLSGLTSSAQPTYSSINLEGPFQGIIKKFLTRIFKPTYIALKLVS
jgi:hypothetical protein